MKKLIQSIGKFLFSPKGTLLLLFGLVLLVHPDLVHAATDTTIKQNTEQTIASAISTAIDFLNKLLWPVLLMIGDLMGSNRILGPGMEDRLLSIWVQVRNLVNICFVLVLLFVALYNAMGFGGGEGEMAIKTALPKIVLGLILVNFTFVGGKIAIDLTSIATTAVFSLPEMAGQEGYTFKDEASTFERNVCVKSYLESDPNEKAWWVFWNKETDVDNVPVFTEFFCNLSTADVAYKAATATEEAVAQSYVNDYNGLAPLIKANYFQQLNENNVGLVMAVNMGNLSSMGILSPKGIDTFADLTAGMLFSVLMFIIFAISYIVLAIILITRIIVLWIALALSPIGVLIYVVPQIKEWAGGGGDITQKLIKQLIAPIIIGGSFSLGYIMISAWGDVGNAGLAFGGANTDAIMSKEFLLRGSSDLPHLIIAIASVVIVWMGVGAAASGTFSEFATNAVRGLGEKVGGFVAKAPLYANTLTVGTKEGETGGKTSVMAMLSTADQLMRSQEYGSDMKASMEAITSASPWLAKKLGSMPNRQDPGQNMADITAARGSATSLTPDGLRTMVKPLLDNIAYSAGLGTKEKAALERDIRSALDAGDAAGLKKIQDIVRDNNAEKLGLTESQYKAVKAEFDAVHEITKTRTDAPPPPARTDAPPPPARTDAPPPPARTDTPPPAPVVIIPGGDQVGVMTTANLGPAQATVEPALAAGVAQPQVQAAITALNTARAVTTNTADQNRAIDRLIAHINATNPAPAGGGTPPPPPAGGAGGH